MILGILGKSRRERERERKKRLTKMGIPRMYLAVALFFITNLFSLYRLSTSFPPPPTIARENLLGTMNELNREKKPRLVAISSRR